MLKNERKRSKAPEKFFDIPIMEMLPIRRRPWEATLVLQYKQNVPGHIQGEERVRIRRVKCACINRKIVFSEENLVKMNRTNHPSMRQHHFLDIVISYYEQAVVTMSRQ
jgi:hypothetical protein